MVQAGLFSMEAMGARPRMNPECTVVGQGWRIGILTDRLVRFEWSDDGVFVDDATPFAIDRWFDPPPFTVRKGREGSVSIETDQLVIDYDGKAFSREGLSVHLKRSASADATWHYGDRQCGNLGGTTRTLDQVNGSVKLDPGLIAKDGWALIDDSRTDLIRRADRVAGEDNPFGTWVFAKTSPSEDLYFFGYDQDIGQAIDDYCHLAGPTPLLPRFVFGNWWSRYHAYSSEEYEDLLERFDREGIPFTVAVIDMDWHLVDIDPRYGSGWTGYTWNRDLFPDPPAFLDWLHRHGLKTTLSLHPRDGVRAFEDRYADAARAAGIDPASGRTVDFDVTSPRKMAAYFDCILHPMQEEGVDFWWVDWQQGSVARQKDLDPLWLLNHLHYLDSAGGPGSRPLTFSRYAGPGSHRYPIGFSGDTIVSWESLKFQPYFTAMASNIGYGWWSHDIGGHMFGYRDEELQARWYQLGTFSPICRLHSTSSPFNGKEPWNFHEPARQAMIRALRLRHALIPYLYSMNRRAAYENRPLVEPMYWNYRGGNVPTQFQFGTEMIVSPVLEPNDRQVQRGRADVWFPQGLWFDWSDGRHYASPLEDGRTMQVWRGLDRVPVFCKAGGIVPLQDLDGAGSGRGRRLNSVTNPDSLTVCIFPGADGHFVLWEDDGGPQDSVTWVRTDLVLNWRSGRRSFVIGPARLEGGSAADGGQGESAAGEDGFSGGEGGPSLGDVIPGMRRWRLRLRGVDPLGSDQVRVTVDGEEVAPAVSYDRETLTLTVDLGRRPCGARIEVGFLAPLEVAENPTSEDVFSLLQDAQMLYFTKEKAWQEVQRQGGAALPSLLTMEMPPGDYGEPAWFSSHMPSSVIGAMVEILSRDQR